MEWSHILLLNLEAVMDGVLAEDMVGDSVEDTVEDTVEVPVGSEAVDGDGAHGFVSLTSESQFRFFHAFV